MTLRKKLFLLIAVIAFTLATVYGYSLHKTSIVFAGSALNSSLELKVPDKVKSHIEKNFKETLEEAKDFSDELSTNDINFSNLKLGKPYIVNNIEEKEQDSVYYYPVYDITKQKIYFIIEAINTSNEITINFSKGISEELNKLNYLNKTCVLFKDENGMIGENEHQQIIINGRISTNLEKYKKLIFKQKLDDIISVLKNMKVVEDNNEPNNSNPKIGAREEKIQDNDSKKDVKDYNKIAPLTKKKYVPKLISKGSKKFPYKYCKLHKPKGQGYHGLCWAASCETIVNYNKGKNLTAKEIAKYMKIGVDDGATDEKSQKAMKHYGVSYKLKDSPLSFEVTKKNIEEKFPIFITTEHKKKIKKKIEYDWHAVTLYGYKMNKKRTPYILIWNSGLNGGKGATQIIKYKKKGTKFSYCGDVFTWIATISKIK